MRSFLRLKMNLAFFFEIYIYIVYIFIFIYSIYIYLYICLYLYISIYIYWKKESNVLHSFAKERNILTFFYVLCKRTKHSLRSFTVFAKERCILSSSSLHRPTWRCYLLTLGQGAAGGQQYQQLPRTPLVPPQVRPSCRPWSIKQNMFSFISCLLSN